MDVILSSPQPSNKSNEGTSEPLVSDFLAYLAHNRDKVETKCRRATEFFLSLFCFGLSLPLGDRPNDEQDRLKKDSMNQKFALIAVAIPIVLWAIWLLIYLSYE